MLTLITVGHAILMFTIIAFAFYHFLSDTTVTFTLRDKFVSNHDEQHCDACERAMRPDRAVYYGEECNFAARIGCVIPWASPHSIILHPSDPSPHFTVRKIEAF